MVRRPGRFISAFVFIMVLPALAGICRGQQPATPAPEAEQDIVIVKYGSLSVASREPGARVMVDGVEKGGADDIIEGVITGSHLIACTAGGKTVSGSFTIRKNETLKLEALFDEGKLVLFREAVKQAEAEKNEAVLAKAEKPRKPAPKPKKPEPRKPEPRKVERKNPVEERRRNHLNVMKLEYGVTDAQAVVITPEENRQVISKFATQKETTGKYYRTKQGVLLCDAGPCEMSWKATFLYTDETGKADAILFNWRQIVFNGATPAGTSKRELECCLNGQCWKMQDTQATDSVQEYDIGRYRLAWTKTSVLLRRTDIMKEILTAGRSLADY